MITRLTPLAFIVVLVGCPSQPPPVDPADGGEEDAGVQVACEPACNPGTQVCNFGTGLCEWNDATRPQQALVAARAAAHGTADLLIDGALVTYALTGEPAATGVNGFFLQWRQEGPALFIAVDPATLSPEPRPGDKVKLRVTQMFALYGTREARAITGYERLSTGHDLAPLVQEVSALSTLVGLGESYDGELVNVEGRLRHDWLELGEHFKSELELPHLWADPRFVLRANDSVARPLGLGTNCQIALERVPLKKANEQMQVWAFREEEFTRRECAPTRLQSAMAMSPTEVRLIFERELNPSTINPDGSQFDFGLGLLGKHASVQAGGREVRVVTAVQTARAKHQVSVAASARDRIGGQLAVPADKGAFDGFFPRALLRFNELNCGMPNERDLFELYVVEGGSTSGLQLTYQGTPSHGLIGTFPDAEVAAGDLIVVHTSVSPVYGDSVYSETQSKDEITAASNYLEAWDFVFDNFTCRMSNVVLRLKTLEGATMDGVALARSDLTFNQRPADYPAWLKELQLDDHWLPRTCNGLTCTYSTQPSAVGIAANWTGVGLSNGVNTSISRNNLGDTDSKDDWVVTSPASFGALNPGQQPPGR